jgi:hypothetical protein
MGEMKKLREGDPKGWEHVYEQVDGRKHAFPEKGPGPGMEWMASHVRDPRPAKVVWQPVRAWKTSFYWLHWADPWIGAKVVAEADRASNTIAITVGRPTNAPAQQVEAERASRVAGLSVWLDERLVDMKREVVVTVDGKERFRGVPAASLATLVSSAAEREDPQYCFPAEAAWGGTK